MRPPAHRTFDTFTVSGQNASGAPHPRHFREEAGPIEPVRGVGHGDHINAVSFQAGALRRCQSVVHAGMGAGGLALGGAGVGGHHLAEVGVGPRDGAEVIDEGFSYHSG